MRHTFAISALALVLSAAVAPANAASTSATFNVTATVNALCKVSANNLNFDAGYVPGGGAANTTSMISVNCTNTTPFTVALNAGSSTGATFSTRAMTSTVNGTAYTLAYQLYTDNTYTPIWGDGTSSTSTKTGTGAGMGTPQAQSLTVYGQIPDTTTNQTAAPGIYSDTVTVTVSY